MLFFQQGFFGCAAGFLAFFFGGSLTSLFICFLFLLLGATVEAVNLCLTTRSFPLQFVVIDFMSNSRRWRCFRGGLYLDQLGRDTQFVKFMKILAGDLSVEVAPQGDSLARKEVIHALGIVDAK